MTKYNIICSKCKKRIILEADDSERPGFCPFCACAVSYERINNSVNSDYTDENVSDKVIKIIQSYTGVVNKMVWRKLDLQR